MNIADALLFILDPSAHCGYPLEEQLRLLEEVKGLVQVPIVVVANKADLTSIPEYPSMSTGSGEGVQEILMPCSSTRMNGNRKDQRNLKNIRFESIFLVTHV